MLSINGSKLKLLSLFSARLKFSIIFKLGQVPRAGFWYTLPIFFIFLYSGHLVISFPSKIIFPCSIGIEPQIILSNVVLPEPFDPTIDKKSFSFISRLKSSKIHDSVTSPKLYNLWMFLISD